LRWVEARVRAIRRRDVISDKVRVNRYMRRYWPILLVHWDFRSMRLGLQRFPRRKTIGEFHHDLLALPAPKHERLLNCARGRSCLPPGFSWRFYLCETVNQPKGIDDIRRAVQQRLPFGAYREAPLLRRQFGDNRFQPRFDISRQQVKVFALGL
jgi:hypothetical protein